MRHFLLSTEPQALPIPLLPIGMAAAPLAALLILATGSPERLTARLGSADT
jgi:hypothetical protein